MSRYSVRVYNDMGHLLIDKYSVLPITITDFIYNKSKNCLSIFYDQRLGCRFYALNEGLQKQWVYAFGSDSVEIEWDLPTVSQLSRDISLVRATPATPDSVERSLRTTRIPINRDTSYGLSSGSMSPF